MVKLPADAGYHAGPFPPGHKPTPKERATWDVGVYSFDDLNPEYVKKAGRGMAVNNGKLLAFCEICGMLLIIRPTVAEDDDPPEYDNYQLATVSLCPTCTGMRQPRGVAVSHLLQLIPGVRCETCNRLLPIEEGSDGWITVPPCPMCTARTEASLQGAYLAGYADGRKNAGKPITEEALARVNPEDSEMFRDIISVASPTREYRSFHDIFARISEVIEKRKRVGRAIRQGAETERPKPDYWDDVVRELPWSI